MIRGWLRRRPHKPRESFTVVIEPSGRELAVASGQSILEAALKAGLPFPHNCRSGICHACRCQLLEGEVYQRREKSRFSRPLDEFEPNTILACQSEPCSTLRIHVDARGNRPITKY